MPAIQPIVTNLGQNALQAGDIAAPSYLTLPGQGTTNPWNAGYLAALRAASSAPVPILMIGEDPAQGFWSDDWRHSWFDLWRAQKLAQGYPLGGDFIPPYYSPQAVSPIVFPGTVPYNIPGSSVSFCSWGLGASVLLGTNADIAANPLTFNSATMPTPAWTDADIILQNRQTSATITYHVDAGSDQTGTLAAGDDSLCRIAVPTQSSGAHTITINGVSVDNTHCLIGICTYQSRTTGLQFARLALDGDYLSGLGFDTVNNPGAVRPADRIRLLQGPQHSGALTGFGFPTQPVLAIIEVGSQVMQNARSVISFEANLWRLCEALRYGQSACSILFIIPNVPNPISSIWVGGGKVDVPNATQWGVYANAIQRVAAEYGAAVYNNHADWGSSGFENGYLNSGTPIPNLAGHTRIAQILGQVA